MFYWISKESHFVVLLAGWNESLRSMILVRWAIHLLLGVLESSCVPQQLLFSSPFFRLSHIFSDIPMKFWRRCHDWNERQFKSIEKVFCIRVVTGHKGLWLIGGRTDWKAYIEWYVHASIFIENLNTNFCLINRGGHEGIQYLQDRRFWVVGIFSSTCGPHPCPFDWSVVAHRLHEIDLLPLHNTLCNSFRVASQRSTDSFCLHSQCCQASDVITLSACKWCTSALSRLCIEQLEDRRTPTKTTIHSYRI